MTPKTKALFTIAYSSLLAICALLFLAGCKSDEPAEAKHFIGHERTTMKHVRYYPDGDECGETKPDSAGGFLEIFTATEDGVLLGQGGGRSKNGAYLVPTYLGGTIEGHTETWEQADKALESGCKP